MSLHFDDIRTLLDILNRLVDKGNTVLVIEHNLDEANLESLAVVAFSVAYFAGHQHIGEEIHLYCAVAVAKASTPSIKW